MKDLVRGRNSRRVLLQIDEDEFLVIRGGTDEFARLYKFENTPDNIVGIEKPLIEPFDGELTDEEWAIVAKWKLLNA